MRGQVSLDLLFAVAIIAITMLSVMNVALSERTETEVTGTAAQLKAFAIDLRGTVARLYTSPGMTVVKESPVKLGPGDSINVTLTEDGYIRIKAQISGREYVLVQKLQVPPGTTSSVVLTQAAPEFKVSSRRSPDGVQVILET